MSSPKVWFVTGASSGLGLAVVKHALHDGDNVVATLRKPSAISSLAAEYSTQLYVLPLDVVNESEIAPAFAKAHAKFGRIDIVYNNAGISLVGEVESTPKETARKLFEVNFWGASNITREAVRVFRDVNSPPGGRLLQASSISGVVGYPMVGYYCATKFALEGLTDSIAGELDPSWNIKITIISLGGYRTAGVAENMTLVPTHPKYPQGEALRGYMDQLFAQFGDSAKAAREIYNIAKEANAPGRVLLGLDSIAATKEKAQLLLDQAEKSEVWSKDLKFDD